jgi:pseudaminic acid biosynthesis-associated methylase
MINTRQMGIWSGNFGREYTDRNPHTVEELNSIYQKRYGITRSMMNTSFIGNLPKNTKILEVGCNIGVQLQSLQQMGFNHLTGIELQHYAVKIANKINSNINILEGSAFELPFSNNSFGLIFTSGVLIHISPEDINYVIDEMYRCSKRYIWGFEYYSKDWKIISYRDNNELLWKANYCQLFMNRFSTLELIKKQMFRYKDSDNQDMMYLLKKEN